MPFNINNKQGDRIPKASAHSARLFIEDKY